MNRIKPNPSVAVTHARIQKHHSARSQTEARVRDWQHFMVRPDIANCLAFSKLRCVISIISLVLLVTDIPRSGLGVKKLSEFYSAVIAPDTAVRFGPYNYPVQHIWRVENNNSADQFKAQQGQEPVESANVWSYQYDSTSMGLRGAVELLNVTEFPDHLLYRGRLGQNNQRGVLSLRTTFEMLDAFISAAQDHLLPEGDTTSLAGFRFATKNDWVDRIHQFLTYFIKPKRFWSLHSLHTRRLSNHSQSFDICTSATSASNPRFCTYPGFWTCTNPGVNASLSVVKLWDHLDLRVHELQRQYSDLIVELVLLSTHRPFMTSGTLSYTFFNYEEQEVVMLTRGRRCKRNNTGNVSGLGDCTTIFVDDYRYERSTLETNVMDWYVFIAIVRGGAQVYFWIRLVLLYHTAYIASELSGRGRQHWYTRFVSTITTVFKIPFQVIVYSSPIPVACYVVALLLDGNFMDIFLDSFWSSVEGSTNFEIVPFIDSTVTQMRTVWLMALIVNIMGFVARKPRNGVDEKLPGVRGLVISFTSSLTVFGPYKQTKFRNSKLLSVIRLHDAGKVLNTVQAAPQWRFNDSTYLFDDSITMLIFCITVVGALVTTARLVSFFMRVDHELLLASTPNTPCGIESIWPTSSLGIRFNTTTSDSSFQIAPRTQPAIPKISPEPQIPPSPLETHFNPLQTNSSPQFSGVKFSNASLTHQMDRNSWLFWRRKRSTKLKQPIASGLSSRTVETQSIVQLMNIAMMTDPWNFLWLHVIGIQLYLYKIRPTPSSTYSADTSSSLLSYAVILPYAENEMEERTGLSSDEFQLLDSASSRDVPMYILLQCG